MFVLPQNRPIAYANTVQAERALQSTEDVGYSHVLDLVHHIPNHSRFLPPERSDHSLACYWRCHTVAGYPSGQVYRNSHLDASLLAALLLSASDIHFEHHIRGVQNHSHGQHLHHRSQQRLGCWSSRLQP